MLDPGVGGNRSKQQGAVAMGGVALEAKQGRRFFGGEIDHHRALGDGFGKLELACINTLQVVVAAGAGGGTAVRRRPERAQVDIVDSDLVQCALSGVLEKPGRRERGRARTSIMRCTPAPVSAAINSATVAPS